MTIPYWGEEFEFTQPDGTKIELRVWGNQYSAIFETLSGHPVIRNADDGYYVYALTDKRADHAPAHNMRVTYGSVAPEAVSKLRQLPSGALKNLWSTGGMPRLQSRWEERRAIARAQAEIAERTLGAPLPAPPQRQTIGSFVGLTIPVNFPNSKSNITQQQIDNFCNDPNYEEFGNRGSVSSYFRDISNGRLQYTNVVVPFYTAKHDFEYYANKDVKYGIRARELVEEALASLKKNEFDFTRLTADRDDYVHAINLFYSEKTMNNYGEGLWPHQSTLMPEFKLSSNRFARDYQITNIGGRLSMATFCHENGHMICDFPDLYDYKTDGFESNGVGVFCLMAHGGRARTNPAHVSAYLKWKAGWSDRVINIRPGEKVTLTAGMNEFAIYRKNASEYFIIEYRTNRGRDSSLPSSGLAIWHVDERGDNEHQNMEPNRHYECSIEQADGKFELEAGIGIGDIGDLFHDPKSRFDSQSIPNSNWWDGSKSGLNIKNFKVNGDSISFECIADGVS